MGRREEQFGGQRGDSPGDETPSAPSLDGDGETTSPLRYEASATSTVSYTLLADCEYEGFGCQTQLEHETRLIVQRLQQTAMAAH